LRRQRCQDWRPSAEIDSSLLGGLERRLNILSAVVTGFVHIVLLPVVKNTEELSVLRKPLQILIRLLKIDSFPRKVQLYAGGNVIEYAIPLLFGLVFGLAAFILWLVGAASEDEFHAAVFVRNFFHVTREEQAAPPRGTVPVLLPDRANPVEDVNIGAPTLFQILAEIVQSITPISMLAGPWRELGSPSDRVAQSDSIREGAK